MKIKCFMSMNRREKTRKDKGFELLQPPRPLPLKHLNRLIDLNEVANLDILACPLKPHHDYLGPLSLLIELLRRYKLKKLWTG